MITLVHRRLFTVMADVLQFDLVCGDEWQISFVSTVYLFGVLIGAPLSGVLSDKYAYILTSNAMLKSHENRVK